MNHLKTETSPYLLQHADNPVHWYPWGDEAFAAARKQDKPILLSIGYAACHWCHVMAHESFEHEPTADIMNEHFINIKVDREERPDVDRIYMAALIALTQSGGWPLTAFLTPEGKPFYAGTYFPPQPRHQMPSFAQVLLSMAQHWTEKKQQVLDSANGITRAIAQRPTAGKANAVLPNNLIEKATASMASQFDSTWGGFNDAPKFPQPMTLEFLLRSTMK
ncbi:MAG: thioredoxin domain-containing protein, partial [Anaerolineae bacterium]